MEVDSSKCWKLSEDLGDAWRVPCCDGHSAARRVEGPVLLGRDEQAGMHLVGEVREVLSQSSKDDEERGEDVDARSCRLDGRNKARYAGIRCSFA